MLLRLPTGVRREDVEVQSLGAVQAAVDAFDAAGGVVCYSLVAVSPSVDDVLAHQSAAVVCVDEAYAPYEFTVDPDAPRGRRITVEELVGRHYDWERRRLTSSWRMSGGTGYKIGGGTDGYADAFSDPPYRLTAPLEKVADWFEAINDGLFGGLSRDLDILEWSTDWSNFFDPGDEWWGSFCWTVRRPSAATITAICASSTD